MQLCSHLKRFLAFVFVPFFFLSSSLHLIAEWKVCRMQRHRSFRSLSWDCRECHLQRGETRVDYRRHRRVLQSHSWLPSVYLKSLSVRPSPANQLLPLACAGSHCQFYCDSSVMLYSHLKPRNKNTAHRTHRTHTHTTHTHTHTRARTHTQTHT